MSPFEDYIAKANECDALAAKQVDASLREGWLAMAAQWRRLAENIVLRRRASI